MNLLNLPFILLLSLSSLIAIVFAGVAFRVRKTMPGGVTVSVIGLSVAWWSIGYLGEVLTPTLEGKLFFANLKQIGTVTLPSAALIFALRYTQFIKSVNKWLILFLSLEPLVALFLYWRDSGYENMYVDPTILSVGSFHFLDFQFGDGYYLHFSYTAGITVAAIVLLAIRYFKSEALYKRQSGFILAGLLIPFVGAFLTIMGLIPSYFDAAPLLLGFSFPVMVFGLIRNQFFTLLPVNTNVILDKLPYGLMVVEISERDRIISLNPVAEKLLQISQAEAQGHSVREYLPEWDFQPAHGSTRMTFDMLSRENYYQVQGYHLSGIDNVRQTWLVLFHDLTDQQRNAEQLRASEEKHRLLAENASDVIWTIDLKGNFTYVSPSVMKLRGYSVEEVLSQSMQQALTPESMLVVSAAMDNMRTVMQQKMSLEELQTSTRTRFILEQTCKDGSTVWTEAETSLLVDGNQQVIGVQGVSRDITDRKKYEKDLLAARHQAEEQSRQTQEALRREQQLHTITRTISSSMELETILSDLLRQTLEITGTDETRLGLLSEDGSYIHFQYGMNRESTFFVDHKTPRDRRYLCWQIVDQRKGVLLDRKQIELAQGFIPDDFRSMGAQAVMGVPVMSGLTVMGILAVFTRDVNRHFSQFDLTMMESIGSQAGIAIQNAHLFAEVNQLAVTDPLTHLYNRRYFFNLARVELERARRYGHQLSIIMMDIDLFKRVNDTYGHLAGDETLVSLADCVRSNLRQVDLPARYGGEEIVILLPETDLTSATTTAERLCQAIHDLRVPFNGDFISVTVSVGVASLQGQQITDVSKILDQADQALYIAKENGRNRVVVYPQ